MFIRGGTGLYRQFPDFEQVMGALALPGAGAQRAAQYDLGFEQRIGTSVRWQVTIFDREEDGFFRRARRGNASRQRARRSRG